MLRWNDAEKTRHSGAIQAYIDAASELVEAEAGPFEARTVVHVSDGGRSIALPTSVTSVTTVEVGGVETTDYTVNLGAGIVYGPFSRGSQNVTITYETGYAEVPAAAKLAATMIAVDKWAIASQRAPRLDDQVDPTYLLPKVVRELLAPFKTMPGFA